MKITPMAASNIGSVSTNQSTHSPDTVAAAKAAFMGQNPADIPAQPSPLVQDLNVRRIKMRTNYSPEYETSVVSEQQNITESVNSGDNKQDNPLDVRKPISPQLAALAKERRQLQVMKQELLAKEKALEEKTSTNQSVDIENLKSNWLDILLNNGMTYEQLIEAVAAKGPGTDPAVFEMKKKISDLETKLESSFKDRDIQAEQQVLQELRKEANRITAQGDDFEAIRATKSQGKIVEFIEKQYRKTGEVLDVNEAAKIIENILIEDAIKTANFKKVQSKLTPQLEIQSQPLQQTQQLKTLTNRQTATPPMSRKQRAIAAANGRLQKG